MLRELESHLTALTKYRSFKKNKKKLLQKKFKKFERKTENVCSYIDIQQFAHTFLIAFFEILLI